MAGDWEFSPEVSLRETYSDNIMLAGDSQIEQQDYVTEVVPSLEILGVGNRLDLRANYRLQNIYYSENSTRNQASNQFLLGTVIEVVEDWFFLDLTGEQKQKSISKGDRFATDNLTPVSGRSDVLTTKVAPRVMHNFGQGVALEMGYSENKTRYDAPSVADTSIKREQFGLSRSPGFSRLSWALNYDQDRQDREGVLSSERKASRGVLRYQVLNQLSVVANSGREEGTIVGRRSFRQGSYWSVGALWVPTPYFLLELSSGESDKQGVLTWTPTARTSLEISYVDRSVGVRPSTAWSGSFNHRARRTVWGLSYVEEISNDSRLQMVGQATNVFLSESGEPMLELIDLYDITNEEFTRAYARADFSFVSRKNVINLTLTRETRDYETIAQNGVTRGVVASWQHHFNGRTQSSVLYSNSSKRGGVLNEIKTSLLSFGLSRDVGRRTRVGMEYRQAVLDYDDANKGYVENRLSANLKMAF